MKIELRKIQVYERMSEETLAYSASVYIDGKYAGHVRNHGQGGCDEQHLAEWVDRDALNKHIAATRPPLSMKQFGMPDIPADLERECQRQAGIYCEFKKFRRSMRTKILTYENGEVLQYGLKGTKAITPNHITAFKMAKGLDKVVLNGMSDEQLLAVLEKVS